MVRKGLIPYPPGVGGSLQKVASEALFCEFLASEAIEGFLKGPPQAENFEDFLESEAVSLWETVSCKRILKAK